MTVHPFSVPALAGRPSGDSNPVPEVSSLAELATLLSRRLSHCRRRGEQLAVLWVEVEPMTDIAASAPDTVGEMLRVAGLRLRHRVRGTDDVVRVGAASFAVLLPTADAKAAAWVAQRLKQVLTGAYGVQHERTYLAVAMGEAVFPEAGRTALEVAEAARRSAALWQGG